MYGIGKVDLIEILSVLLLDYYVRSNELVKVVHNKPCENLLKNIVRLF